MARASQRSRARLRRITVRVLLVGVAVVALWGGYEVLTWPDVAALARTNPPATAFIVRYQRSSRQAGRDDRVDQRWVAYARISPHLKRAVLVAEDINFFTHHGFETAEIKKTLEEALADKELPRRGASTITQQLVKNLWLSPSHNPLRKLKEALLTRQVERALDKRRILELYLNVAEFGRGIYGVEAAAQHYFGKPAATIDPGEAAQLAASLPRPSTWHPGCGRRGYARYVADIERRMERAEFLWKQI